MRALRCFKRKRLIGVKEICCFTFIKKRVAPCNIIYSTIRASLYSKFTSSGCRFAFTISADTTCCLWKYGAIIYRNCASLVRPTLLLDLPMPILAEMMLFRLIISEYIYIYLIKLNLHNCWPTNSFDIVEQGNTVLLLLRTFAAVTRLLYRCITCFYLLTSCFSLSFIKLRFDW